MDSIDEIRVSTSMVHILDDFLIIEKSKEDAISKLKAFINLCEDLGYPYQQKKTELPSQTMDFVGITLDVIKQEARRTVFENSPSCSTQTVLSSTSNPATELLEYVTILANAALAPSTQATYSRAWKTFDSFCTEIMNQSLQPPISVATISLFIAYMFKKSYAPSTISTYLSAIAYVHKMMSMPDNTRSFLVEKLVTGTYRLSKTFDSRLPITIPILNKLLHSITLVIKCTYDQVLFKAIFLFAFSTFSRVGELVTTKNAPNDNVLLLHDVSLSYVQGKAAEVQVCFRKFKHNVRGMPKTISFSHGTAMESAVVAMVEYLKVRPYSVPT
ncbi:unnamed protein product [Mytilus coruscus]|uniref:Reverse transcriptase domain-containing protein n=1 Tax=Mytilus coruscus TaxID=42192 RepID=A0A6J7ZXP8_MYTCO|nr:unnamed protein product [Mytilus coruscus]